jgi:integrase
LKQGWVKKDPSKGVPFFPVEKKVKYVPPSEDIDKVISVADQDTQDYLCAIRETMGRMGEINNLLWEDINLRYCIRISGFPETFGLLPKI